MTRRKHILSLPIALFAATTRLSAHDDFRVVGTITKVSASQLSVRNREGKSFSIAMNKQTAVTRDKKKVPASELKTGLSVVVDATGDTEKDLLALEVRIVPAP